jgi:Domain of unknown function (DUF4112)
MKPQITDRQAQEVEWEVLPPEETEKRARLEPIFRWVALVMDELLRVPGTRFRFGLDPLIGLFPGFGDTASALVSALTLIQAARLGLPKILLARMSLNILINELIGIIPGVGDAFSFWFKSNTRNYNLLQRHIVAPRQSRNSDWIFVAAVLGLVFVIVCGGLLVSVFVLNELLKLLSRS